MAAWYLQEGEINGEGRVTDSEGGTERGRRGENEAHFISISERCCFAAVSLIVPSLEACPGDRGSEKVICGTKKSKTNRRKWSIEIFRQRHQMRGSKLTSQAIYGLLHPMAPMQPAIQPLEK